VTASTLQKLVALAREPSSEKRRRLLREVTDLFFETPPEQRSQAEADHFDVILSAVADEMTVEVRQELARRFSGSPEAPRQLMRHLAHDDISVAGEILRRSLALDDDDLISVARSETQDHLQAIASRTEVSERVSNAVGERADPATMKTLVGNSGAALSRRTLRRAVDQAPGALDLQDTLIQSGALPPDLLAQMYSFVEQRLREKIEHRAGEVSEAAISRALAPAGPGQDADTIAEAESFARKARAQRELDAGLLARLMREGDRPRLFACFAVLTDIDYDAARGVFDDPSNEALAMVCKACRLERSLFVTIAILRNGERARNVRAARELAQLFNRTPLAEAERAMRFWRLRKAVAENAEIHAA